MVKRQAGAASTLEGRIRSRIEADGPMAFGEYLDACLYDPAEGFYAAGGAGRRRDFITAPEVGPLFGRLVAEALDRWWTALGRPAAMRFVEVGAGPGTLARGVLAATPACGAALRYVAVERSVAQRAKHPSGIVSLPDLPEDPAEYGIVFANELLDNLAFDLYEWIPGAGWHEVRVGLAGDRLAEVVVASPHASPLGPGVEPDRRVRVPDQWGARQFLERALHTVDHGRVVVLDYAVEGFPVEPDRRWLRTYRGHDHGGDPLDAPGSQDITVDVALDQLARVVPPTVVRSQADWLRDLGIDALVEEGRRYWAAHAADPGLEAMRMRSRINEAAALLDPAGLGAFRVVEWELG